MIEFFLESSTSPTYTVVKSIGSAHEIVPDIGKSALDIRILFESLLDVVWLTEVQIDGLGQISKIALEKRLCPRNGVVDFVRKRPESTERNQLLWWIVRTGV